MVISQSPGASKAMEEASYWFYISIHMLEFDKRVFRSARKSPFTNKTSRNTEKPEISTSLKQDRKKTWLLRAMFLLCLHSYSLPCCNAKRFVRHMKRHDLKWIFYCLRVQTRIRACDFGGAPPPSNQELEMA